MENKVAASTRKYLWAKKENAEQYIPYLKEFEQYLSQYYSYALRYRIIKPLINISKNIGNLLEITEEDVRTFYWQYDRKTRRRHIYAYRRYKEFLQNKKP
ncbi:hypothetical protein OCC_02302 [Thermococcus litoralis DSM 5473]|uniref:Core-binding (CB) domain-containing protein n=1 Tax=Thermococcus litoralis (strain ATCC 51850 / DSM 5473 / JCM 8560 / NS-C) TaxID=523849 RepID=H3ZMJ2_THELN|nr:hypothetical protein [Thermococcus litoralis]EHR78786.1 hypothetical protein OCC_02302 [Thermococcus litoralis DSM 5473]